MKDYNQIKKSLLNIFFPKFCLGCGREGTYFCEDCKACLEVSENIFCLCEIPKRLIKEGKCEKCKSRKLNGLYFAVSYQNKIIKKLIRQFKYEPFIKELAKPLAGLIITYFMSLNKDSNFWKGKFLTPIPLHKRKLKKRGFNQAEEIAKNLSNIFEIPLCNYLIKTKETLSQTELSKEEREENMNRVFSVERKGEIKDKIFFLVDDVYTTGATMNEAAKVLKEAGAKEVWGITIARGF